MNTLKSATVTALTVLLVAATAASFGSFASQTEKNINGNQASFDVNVFNLGEKTYQLEINSEDVEGAGIYHPDSYTIAPSKKTSNPEEGGNWFTMENGEYVKTAEIPVDFQKLPDTDKRNFEFMVTVKAMPQAGEEVEGSTYHKLQQVRTYTFNVETSPRQRREDSSSSFTIPPRQEDQNDNRRGPIENVQRTIDSINPFTGGETETREGPETDVKKSEPVKEKTDRSLESPRTPEENSEKTENRQTGGFFASGSHITLILLAGVATTALYLFKVM